MKRSAPAIPKIKGVIASIHSFPFKMFEKLVDNTKCAINPTQARAHARDVF